METDKIANYVNSANKYGDLNTKGQAMIVELLSGLIEQIKVLNTNLENIILTRSEVSKSTLEVEQVRRVNGKGIKRAI